MFRLLLEGEFIAALALVLAVIIALVVHEFFHAFAAVRCGDLTPKLMGRYTLNPIRHFDIIGFILMMAIGFGWAKPVPINPNNFGNYKRDMVMVSSAGIISNLALAFVSCPFALLCLRLPQSFFLTEFLIYFTEFLFLYNVVFAVFNLIPIYPLDGFKIIEALAKPYNKFVVFMYKYGQFVLLFILILGTAIPQFDIIRLAAKYVSMPIAWFWGLFIH